MEFSANSAYLKTNLTISPGYFLSDCRPVVLNSSFGEGWDCWEVEVESESCIEAFKASSLYINVSEFPGAGNWGSGHKVKKGLWVILPNLNPPVPQTDKGCIRLLDIQTPSSLSIPCNCHHHMWPKVRNFLFTPEEEKRKNRGWQILWNGPNSEISPTPVSCSLLPFLLQLAFFRITRIILTFAMT